MASAENNQSKSMEKSSENEASGSEESTSRSSQTTFPEVKFHRFHTDNPSTSMTGGFESNTEDGNQGASKDASALDSEEKKNTSTQTLGVPVFVKSQPKRPPDNHCVNLTLNLADRVGVIDDEADPTQASEAIRSRYFQDLRRMSLASPTLKKLVDEMEKLMNAVARIVIKARRDLKRPILKARRRSESGLYNIQLKECASRYLSHMDIMLEVYDSLNDSLPLLVPSSGVIYFFRDPITQELRRQNVINRTVKFHQQLGLCRNKVKHCHCRGNDHNHS